MLVRAIYLLLHAFAMGNVHTTDRKCSAREIKDRANIDGEYFDEVVYIKIIVSANDAVICLFATRDAINYSCAVCMRVQRMCLCTSLFIFWEFIEIGSFDKLHKMCIVHHSYVECGIGCIQTVISSVR